MALVQTHFATGSYAAHSKLRCPASSLPRSRRQMCVTTYAASDLNKLVKKPELRRPDAPEPKKLFGNEEVQAAATVATAPAPPAPILTADSSPSKVTVEFQRQRAREMIAYFKNQKLQESIVKAKTFGWTPSNEIGNGRWVMFGWFVGMLTEYATGVSFPDQLKLMCSYLGILDLD